MRVLDLFSFLLLVQDFSWLGFPSYLQGFASSFGNDASTSGLHAIRGILHLLDFSMFLVVPSGVFRRDVIIYARSDAESASLLCSNLACRDLQSDSENGCTLFY